MIDCHPAGLDVAVSSPVSRSPYFQDFQLSPESRQPVLAVNEAKSVEELIENTIPERLTGSKPRWLSCTKDAVGTSSESSAAHLGKTLTGWANGWANIWVRRFDAFAQHRHRDPRLDRLVDTQASVCWRSSEREAGWGTGRDWRLLDAEAG